MTFTYIEVVHTCRAFPSTSDCFRATFVRFRLKPPNRKVYWQSDDQPKELNFFSISSDGRVASWVMSKNELKMEPVMQLKLVNTIKVSSTYRQAVLRSVRKRSGAAICVSCRRGGVPPFRLYSHLLLEEREER